jgi:hypothetical protein
MPVDHLKFHLIPRQWNPAPSCIPSDRLQMWVWVNSKPYYDTLTTTPSLFNNARFSCATVYLGKSKLAFPRPFSLRKKLRNLITIFQVSLDATRSSIDCILLRAIHAPLFKLVCYVVIVFGRYLDLVCVYLTGSRSRLSINLVVKRARRGGVRRSGAKCIERVEFKHKII